MATLETRAPDSSIAGGTLAALVAVAVLCGIAYAVHTNANNGRNSAKR